MTTLSHSFLPRTAVFTVAVAAAALLLTPLASFAQTPDSQHAAKQQAASAKPAASQDHWLHVRVNNKDSKGEVVRVNVPIELAEKVLPAIHKGRLHDGKVHIDNAHMDDVDLHALIDAVRTAKDGEYVTMQSNDQNVHVAKSGGYLFVKVTDKGGDKNSKVEVKVPMKVVNALFSAGKDEIDIVAALHALSAQGDTELVSVKDHENDIRIWMDSKNVSDESARR